MNFVAIDFETATVDRDSVCAVGLVVVQKGKITDRFSSFIQPPNMEFSPRFTAIHGITPADVADSPTFYDIWPKLSPWFANELLVAHNAAFDVGVLHHCLTEFNLPSPQIKCACTLSMARQLLPGLQDHKLPTLAALFGIDQDHHKALADAVTCARLAILLDKLAGPDDLMHFAQDFADIAAPLEQSPEKTGSVDTVSVRGPSDNVRRGRRNCGEIYAPPLDDATQSDARFAGLKFVFTGEFSAVSREHVESLVKARGGQAVNHVAKSTDYVVVGRGLMEAYLRTGYTTGKLAKGVALKNSGAKVRIIGEVDFLAMII